MNENNLSLPLSPARNLEPKFPSWPKTFSKQFCLVAGLILILFAAAKFFSITGTAPVLLVPEPVFGISNRWFMVIAGLLEWALALALLRYCRVRQVDCLIAISFFCVSAWTYRYALHNVDPQGSCPCLGTVTGKIGLTRTAASNLSLVALIFLSAGSMFSLLILQVFVRKKSVISPLMPVTSLLVLFLAAASISLAPSGYAAQFVASANQINSTIHLEGTISWKSAISGETIASTVTPTHTSRFSVLFDECKYYLEETDKRNGFVSQSLSYDGTNWINTINYDPDIIVTNAFRFTTKGPVSVPPKNQGRKSANPATVIVSPILESLLPKTTSLLPLWLAYGSGCHFRQQTAAKISPLYYMVDPRLHAVQKIRADRGLAPDAMFLQHYTDYWENSLFPAPKGDCSGLTNIVFQATAWTNFASYNIPIGFRFSRYFFSPGGTPNYFQSMEASATVDVIEITASQKSLVPPILTNSMVIHHPSGNLERSSSPQGYLARNAQLKAQIDVDSKAANQSSKGALPRSENTGLRLTIITTAVFIPLIFLLRKWLAKGVVE